jgi:hypothetical protein
MGIANRLGITGFFVSLNFKFVGFSGFHWKTRHANPPLQLFSEYIPVL